MFGSFRRLLQLKCAARHLTNNFSFKPNRAAVISYAKLTRTTHDRAAYKDWAECNGLMHQSPVEVLTSQTTYDASLKDLQFVSFDEDCFNCTLYNNGYFVSVNVPGNRYIQGGSLDGKYILDHFHFHWGSNDTCGSEHILNGITHPMELHIVHFSEKYNSLKDALKQPDGLAVLAVFFQVVDGDNTRLDEIISNLTNVRYKGQEVTLDRVNVKDILPDDLTHFYTYGGSLTTPPCYESVTWILFHKAVNISGHQMQEFRNLSRRAVGEASPPGQMDSEYLSDNFRPPQNLNNRVVYSSVDFSQLSNLNSTVNRSKSVSN